MLLYLNSNNYESQRIISNKLNVSLGLVNKEIKSLISSGYLNKNKETLFPGTVYVDVANEDNEVEIAFQYNSGYNEIINSYANNINTEEGGTHLEGFKNSLTKIINDYGKNNKILKESEKLNGDDVREGLTAIISVKLKDPQFEGQTKTS